MDSSSISARPDVTVATTAPRVTPTPNRGAFKQVLATGLVRGAETAMKVLPGGPLMAVAVRGAGGTGALGVPVGGIGSTSSALSASGPGAAQSGTPSTLASAALSATGVAGSTTGTTTGAAGTGDGSLEATMQQSADMNLYYLKVQEDVNAQNRTFSTLSNVLKAEHDTVKTAIGNIR